MVYSTHATEEENLRAVTKMSEWVDQVLGGHFHQFCHEKTWEPAINLYEDDANYYVVVDLSGVKADEIDLRADNGVLILVGRRDTPRPKEIHGVVRMHLMEIDHGQFARTVPLPDDADVDHVEASYKCGQLWTRIRKRA